MSGTLARFTIADIRSWRPCYDPGKYLPEDWSGTALDILAVKECKPEDRLWVVMRPQLIDDRTARLFAVWCARQALNLTRPIPPLVSNGGMPPSVTQCDALHYELCNVAEKFANGQASKQQLAAAGAAAWDAAWDAAWAAQVEHLIGMLSQKEESNEHSTTASVAA